MLVRIEHGQKIWVHGPVKVGGGILQLAQDRASIDAMGKVVELIGFVWKAAVIQKYILCALLPFLRLGGDADGRFGSCTRRLESLTRSHGRG